MRGVMLGKPRVLSLQFIALCTVKANYWVKVRPLRPIAGQALMDFDDYDSYAPIRPEPPASDPPSTHHRYRALLIVLCVLALMFVVVPFITADEAEPVVAEAVVSLVVSDTRPSPTTTTVAIPAGDDTIVTRVIDGDTIEVAGGTRIRFIGVDTPETTPARGCFGSEAMAETQRMLPANQRVRLTYDVERLDTFGRTLAYVYTLPDGRFVNLALARDGFAVQATFPPNVGHVEELTRAVAEARNAGRGLWAACPAPVPARVAAPPAAVPRVAAPPATTSTTAPLAVRGAVGIVPPTKPPATVPRVTTPPATVTSPGAGGAYYANCTAARAAGAAPLRRGDAGYRSALDRDSDGVACE